MAFKSFGLLNIQVLNVEIIDVSLGIGLEEEVLLEQAEGQALEIVEESLDVNFTGFTILAWHVPVEHVSSVEHFFLFHALIEAPYS